MNNFETVFELDLQKYQGTWYEIARLPFFPERDLVNVTATYSLKEDGKIQVINAGYKHSPDGKYKTAKGTAWRPDENNPGRLKVRFFWPFKSDYLVLDMAKDYSASLVTSSSGNLLWFLCRTPQMPEKTFDRFMGVVIQSGIDTTGLIMTVQDWPDK